MKRKENEKSGIPIVSFEALIVQSNEACTDLYVVDPSEMTTPKMHRDQNDTGLDLHETYIEFC